MLVEILGTRIIGPVFGVSLFVWAALLAVTLSALAIGYYVGGVLVDRQPRIQLLGFVLLVAGALLVLVPLLEHWVLSSTIGLGPRGGPLVAALLLFAPALLVLGMTGPIAVRLATTDVAGAGQRVGTVYAVSTAGSLFGTLATSFWIIPAFETDQTLLGAAALLLFVGATIFARRGRAGVLLAVAFPALGVTASRPTLPPGITMRAGARSPYGLVQVIDDSSHGVRFMRADHSVVGAQWLSDRTAAFAFLHELESVRFLRSTAQDMLVLGLGTGALPTALDRFGIRSDVVEIDPVVVQLAKDYFGFTTRGTTYVEDARTFLRRSDRRYDIIVHDTFTGGATPEHLLSLQVLQEIRQLLRPGGVLALNFVGFQKGPHAAASWAVARTLRVAFHSVRIFRDVPPDHHPDDTSNLLFFASDGPLKFEIPANAQFESSQCERDIRAFASWEVLQDVPPGPVITDEHNDLARLQLAVADQQFKAMNELLPLAVWVK